MRDKFDFLHEHKHQSFLQAANIFLETMARHTQITQKTSLGYLCNISKKKGGMKLIFFFFFFLHADKHDNLQQVDSINFDGHGRSCQKYSK